MEDKFIKFIFALFLLITVLISGCSISRIPADRCNLDPVPGPCKALTHGYYYDHAEGICKDFIWGGCEGVRPFETLEECKKACE